ncbi:MAG: CRISPR-associated helicase/endonuclease Cas3, partial [Ktedonobacterales bacterium]|nr:CRISPR-associated helicase/endonuclease Cas3 [Ktedonobacterales bacterium]
AVLEQVRRRLVAGEPCRLVSTQVIEAGVDVDFPLVLRALGPLDRIVQAAGRCNREGKLPVGRMIIFEPEEGKLPTGPYRAATDITRLMLQNEHFDFHDPAIYRRYFEAWYRNIDPDTPGIQALREQLDYPEVARCFRMIEDTTTPVVVLWREGGHEERAQQLLDALREQRSNARHLLRALHPYIVSLSGWVVEQAERRGLAREVMPGLYEWYGRYDPISGIVLEGPLDVERLIQ